MSAYVDAIAVERACWGDRVYLRPHQRTAGVQRLSRDGRSARTIGETLGLSTRTVVRHRARARVVVAASI